MTDTLMDKELDTRPWYRQGWPWLLISLPASAVVGGLITIVIAVQSPNALVVDDYYKEGLAINQQLERVQHARALNLSALVRFDGKTVSVAPTAHQVIEDDTLTLQFIHATRSDLDRTLTLHRTPGGEYRADTESLQAGNWYLKLLDEDRSWEIRARTWVQGAFQRYLTTEKD